MMPFPAQVPSGERSRPEHAFELYSTIAESGDRGRKRPRYQTLEGLDQAARPGASTIRVVVGHLSSRLLPGLVSR